MSKTRRTFRDRREAGKVLGVPQWPELAMGAVVTGGGVVLNGDLLRGLDISDDNVRDLLAAPTVEH
ncbi:MAG: hypothetical protein ACXWZL_11460 [Mycobacterium sp.]